MFLEQQELMLEIKRGLQTYAPQIDLASLPKSAVLLACYPELLGALRLMPDSVLDAIETPPSQEEIRAMIARGEIADKILELSGYPLREANISEGKYVGDFMVDFVEERLYMQGQ